MMRTLLLLLAVPIVQAALYFWLLRPQEIYWWSLNGIAFATLAIVCWSAVLQIAWRDREKSPDSPIAEPESPDGFRRCRMQIAALFVLLALPAMAGLVYWGIYQGPMVYRVCNSHQELDLDRLDRIDARLPDLVPPIMERRFEVSNQVMRKCIKVRGDAPSNDPMTWYCAKIAPLVKLDLFGKSKTEHTLALINTIRSGNQQEVQALIDAGIDLNLPDPNSGLLPLDEASRCGDPGIIDMLKKNGAKRSPDA